MPVLSKEDWEFWNENGYVVVHNAVPQANLDAALDAIWGFLGQIKQRYQNRHRILPQTLARFSPRFLSQLCRFASVVS